MIVTLDSDAVSDVACEAFFVLDGSQSTLILFRVPRRQDPKDIVVLFFILS